MSGSTQGLASGLSDLSLNNAGGSMIHDSSGLSNTGPPPGISDPSSVQWSYLDPQGQVQGTLDIKPYAFCSLLNELCRAIPCGYHAEMARRRIFHPGLADQKANHRPRLDDSRGTSSTDQQPQTLPHSDTAQWSAWSISNGRFPPSPLCVHRRSEHDDLAAPTCTASLATSLRPRILRGKWLEPVRLPYVLVWCRKIIH